MRRLVLALLVAPGSLAPAAAGPRVDLNQAVASYPRDPADGAAYRPDGYTNLEHYLNELAARRP